MPHISDVTHKIDDIVLRSKAGTEFADNLLKVVKSLFIGLAYPVWKEYKHWDKEKPAPTLSFEFPDINPEHLAGWANTDYLEYKCVNCSNVFKCPGDIKTAATQITCTECGNQMCLDKASLKMESPGVTIEFPEVKFEDALGTCGIDLGKKDGPHWVGIFNTKTGKYRPFTDFFPGKTVFLEDGEKLIEREPMMQKPPLGLMPRKIHREERYSAVERAISNYFFEGKKVPKEWIEEYSGLAEGSL